jgi:hypothetical protein
MSDKKTEADKETKENFRCGNCSFWLVEELRNGKSSIIVRNLEALDRLEKELKEAYN